MPEFPASQDASLEIVSPGTSRRIVRISQSPFLIGRGGEAGNHLQLDDRSVSRHSAAILREDGGFVLEDRGQRNGLHVCGKPIHRCELKDGDVIGFGPDGSLKVTFRLAATPETAIENLFTRFQSMPARGAALGGLGKLNLLLEATMLLHSQLPLDSVLGTMLDHAIALTDADRGLLLEPDASGTLRVRLARRKGGAELATEGLAPSQTAINQAIEKRAAVITEDLAQGDVQLQGAQSIMAQALRAVVAIPLYAKLHAAPGETAAETTDRPPEAHFLGVVYLDSRRPAAFSRLERQILDALAVEAASVLDNARLVEYERQRQRLEQELGIARDIQQALLPRGFRDFPHLTVSGVNMPCLSVGGDYFDVFPLKDGRTAFLIADVSGKGLGAALLTTMLQGALSAMTMGADPAGLFHHLNNFLCEHSEVRKYATMFFGALSGDGGLEYINAGHPPPLLLREGGHVDLFTEGNVPVGLLDGTEYDSFRVKLEDGDTLVLFSDGVSEAMNPEDELYGMARLRESLVGFHDAPLDHIQKAVFQSVETFSRGAGQGDDITLLLVRYRDRLQSSRM